MTATDSYDSIDEERGLAPITTLDSSGSKIDNYLLQSADENRAGRDDLPISSLNKIYNIPGVFNLKMPVLQEGAD